MPGWYIHLDVARKALGSLEPKPGAPTTPFGRPGPTPQQLETIARTNPAYTALGAIGPDIFFLLPDFKPPVGSTLWGAARSVDDIYSWWDTNFSEPFAKELGPIELDKADALGAATGEISKQITKITNMAHAFIMDALVVLAVRQYDIFSLLGSGVIQGYDEQVFFWSDMLHYRKTYEFAAHLWQAADRANNDRFRAFALGWMSHLATDVAGHCFVNEKCGGPYRLHWQRHHLVENHMDAQVYDSEYGARQIYQMLSCSALHLWVGFNPDGTSHLTFFDDQPAQGYQNKDDAASISVRMKIWDPDNVGEMPDDLAAFVSQALKDVYQDTPDNDPKKARGPCADHPRVISSIAPNHSDFAEKDDIRLTYKWLYRYMKMTTTDYFALRRPQEPQVFEPPDSPAIPGLPELDSGLNPNNAHFWPDVLELLLAIFAWMIFLASLPLIAAEALTKVILSAGTYPAREVIYRTVELPLYNAFMALHWYLAMSGFTYPMQGEVNTGLNTLGVGADEVWQALMAALADPLGGIGSHLPTPLGEPSGIPRPNSGDQPQQPFPLDVVAAPQGTVGIPGVFNLPLTACGDSEGPGEFHSPWRWPTTDNEGDLVPLESTLTPPGPFHRAEDATALMGTAPGNVTARTNFENAQCEADTIHLAQHHLPLGEHLGDPVDYTRYVVAQLTKAQDATPTEVANFNLDSDRGYAYLCWDWVRSGTFQATPAAWSDNGHHLLKSGRDMTRAYNAPLRPGAGWCDQDLAEDDPALPLPVTGSQRRPTRHDPVRPDEPPVRIRYIDREDRYWSTPVSAPALSSYTDGGVPQLCVFAQGLAKGVEDHLLIYRGAAENLQVLDDHTLSSTVIMGSPAATGGTSWIFGFARGRYDHLQIHFWFGAGWEWRDQGTPVGTVVNSSPAAITYLDNGIQRHYCFVCGLDGHLHVNFWDGAQWRWADEGAPDTTTVFDQPAALVWNDGNAWLIYAFVLGRNGRLFIHYWDGAQWNWEDAGAPPNVKLAGAPAAITGNQHTQAFVRGSNNHLYAAELRVTRTGHLLTRQWVWSDLGTPLGTDFIANPGAVAYPEGVQQRTYVFVRGKDGQLHVCYWNGQWQWAALGKPDGTDIADAPGAATSSVSGTQWIYVTVRGSDNNYYANYWNGSKWQWIKLPMPEQALSAGGA